MRHWTFDWDEMSTTELLVMQLFFDLCGFLRKIISYLCFSKEERKRAKEWRGTIPFIPQMQITFRRSKEFDFVMFSSRTSTKNKGEQTP